MHPQGANGSSRRSMNLTGFGSSSLPTNGTSKKNKNVFLSRNRGVLICLILVMASTLLYMFQMAHSTSLTLEDGHRPQSALSSALKEYSRGYSTYQTLKKRDIQELQHSAVSLAGGLGERYLTQEEGQNQVDNQYSKYESSSTKPKLKSFGVGHDLEDAQDESVQHEESEPKQVSRPPSDDNRPPDNNNNRGKLNIFSQRKDHGENSPTTGENEVLVSYTEKE